MATIPPFIRIRREDIQGAPEWVDPMLRIFNNAIESISIAFRNNIDIERNLRCVFHDVTVSMTAGSTSGDFPFTIPWKFNDAPRGVIVIKCDARSGDFDITGGAFCPMWDWSNGALTVYNITGLSASKKYDIRLWAL